MLDKRFKLTLSVILTLGLILPVCFHAGVSQAFTPTHQHKMQAHDKHAPQSDQGQCSCGHELTKVYQKSKKAVNAQYISFLPAISSLNSAEHSLKSTFRSTVTRFQPGFISDSSPPLHLLFGVFLN